MREKLPMQNATWLVSREVAEAAGPWILALISIKTEYFCLYSWHPKVPASYVTGIYYRITGGKRVSFIGYSDKKKESLLLSMRLHIQYLRSLEDSERVRKVCRGKFRGGAAISIQSALT